MSGHWPPVSEWRANGFGKFPRVKTRGLIEADFDWELLQHIAVTHGMIKQGDGRDIETNRALTM